jgi:enoyl-CoA hydratase
MEYLKWSNQDGTAVITIVRPPANALSSGLLRELSAVLDEIEPNRDIKV